MTREEIIEALRSAPTTEVDTGRTGKVRQTPLLIAYNGNESWTFHAIEVGGVYSFVATKALPYIDADVKFDNIPEHVFNMKFAWGNDIIKEYGSIGKAMKNLVIS